MQTVADMSFVCPLQNVDTVMSETRLPIIGAVIMTLEAGRPTIVKEQVMYSEVLPRLIITRYSLFFV